MDSNKLDIGLTDAISLLPHEVLAKILSLVPTKLAASTSVLSKKWNNVFALVHNLDFDDSVFLQPQEEGILERDEIRESFRNFVDRTLALQCGSPLKKFSLKFHRYYNSELDSVYRWICNAVDRGVSDMDISIKDCFKASPLLLPKIGLYPVSLPSKLLTSKTLVKLTLGRQINFDTPSLDVYLPALKILSIDSVFFSEGDLCHVLLAGCPVLEELFVCYEEYIGYPYCISSQTIKKLKVYYDCESKLDCWSGMSFDAPSLVFLDYSDYALSEYPQVNLESLVEAKLDLSFTDKIEKPDLTGLVIGISNVETLHLSPDSVDVFAQCCENGLVLPVFDNLLSLSFGSCSKRGWKLLPYLLKQSPKLETLTIQRLDGYIGEVIHPSSFQVKALRVPEYLENAEDWEHLKSFLEGTESLELVRVEIAQDIEVDYSKILQIFKDLLGVVASNKCKVDVRYFI